MPIKKNNNCAGPKKYSTFHLLCFLLLKKYKFNTKLLLNTQISNLTHELYNYKLQLLTQKNEIEFNLIDLYGPYNFHEILLYCYNLHKYDFDLINYLKHTKQFNNFIIDSITKIYFNLVLYNNIQNILSYNVNYNDCLI